MRGTRTRRVVGAVFATALLLISGCAASGDDARRALPPPNREAWTMPLDQFVYTSGPLRDYAEALVERPCYAAYGVDWDVPWQPLDRGLGAGFSTGGQRLFTVDSARRFGYHGAPNEWENRAAWREFIERNEQIARTTPHFDDMLEDCRARSRDALPVVSDEVLYYASEAAAQAYEEARLDEKVLSLTGAWRKCMSQAGYPNVTESPELMPAADLAEKWQVGVPGTTASTAEISMAVADATCADSAGWDEALYREEWERQAAFVEANADRLLRIRDALDGERRMLEAAVADNAPAK
jgi:hypothetical protein